MTDQEREQVLKMIEKGTISPEDGLKLMQTLDQTPADDEIPAGTTRTGDETGQQADANQHRAETQKEKSSFEKDPRIEQVKSTVRRLWQIPLWIGVLITVLSAWGMFSMVQAARFNFWFYCLSAPLLLGVLVIVAAIGSRTAKWIFVDVHQKPGERPSRIFMGFPLPLKFVAGLLRLIRNWFPSLAKEMDDDKNGPGMEGAIKIMELVETGITSNEPLVVNVDEGNDGERVQVYIG
jgi:hypothetical protein